MHYHAKPFEPATITLKEAIAIFQNLACKHTITLDRKFFLACIMAHHSLIWMRIKRQNRRLTLPKILEGEEIELE